MPTNSTILLRHKNSAYNKGVKQGKATEFTSQASVKKPQPVSRIALGFLLFVLLGGLLFEFVRLIVNV